MTCSQRTDRDGLTCVATFLRPSLGMKFIIAIFAVGLTMIPVGLAVAGLASTRTAVAIPEVLRETPTGAARPAGNDVRGHVELAFRALVDAEAARSQGATTASQRNALRKAADGIFDWREMAQDALGEHWAPTTPAQRDRFTRLLAQLFERLYLPLIERTGAPKATKISTSMVYVGETVEGNHAVVRMLWKRSARDLAIDWSLRRTGRTWRIHDIALDGISVVENYRAQIDHLIRRSSYDDLVARMEAKVGSASPFAPRPLATAARPPATRPRPDLQYAYEHDTRAP
jgi:phospholipid transport system substrate-binding protein